MSVSGTTHTFFAHDHWSADIAAAHPPRENGSKSKDLTTFAEDEPSFWDLLDVINPLQHIPVVNNLYRELTGDQIGVAARLAGGTLFGGPIGLAAAAVNAMVEQETGKDAGGHLLALFRGEDGEGSPGEPPVMVAEAGPEEPAGDVPVMVMDAPEAAPVQVASAMIFTSDGRNAAPRAEPMPVPAPAKPLPIVEPQAQAARFMPLPPRMPDGSMKSPPPQISVPISNSGMRSSVPITGRDPVSVLPNQKILEAQGQAAGTDWFSASMAKGLDKYEQANRLGRIGQPENVLVQ